MADPFLKIIDEQKHQNMHSDDPYTISKGAFTATELSWCKCPCKNYLKKYKWDTLPTFNWLSFAKL